MKKIYFFAIALVAFFSSAIAQKRLKMGLEPGVAFPVNNLSQNLKTGYSIELNTAYPIYQKADLYLSVAYDGFSGTKNLSSTPNSTYESINGDLKLCRLGVGLLYYLSPKFSAGGELGFTVPTTGDSKYTQTSISSTGRDISIHTAEPDDYSGGGARTFAGLQVGFSIVRDLKINVSYNFLNQVYGITALNEEVKNLSYLGISIQYRIIK